MQPPDRDVPAVKLAIVIPTRNRAAYAIRAIQALLAQPGCDVVVLVSDNSSAEQEVAHLADFCGSIDDPRLVYLRPPESLIQPAHIDWAIQQALLRSDATHFAMHYDRKLCKPGHLQLLAGAAAHHPETVITYGVDSIRDDFQPVVLFQLPWSGHLFAIETTRVLDLSVHGRIAEMGQAFPILSNCVVPRSVFMGIRGRFGDVCNSHGYDSCFLYRFCALYDQYLHLDQAIGILYGWARSTGIGYTSARQGTDWDDFVALWGERSWMDAAPIPGLNLGNNLIYHEYVLVQRTLNNGRFPSIDMDAYLRDLGATLAAIEEPHTRAWMHAVLEEHGWQPLPTGRVVGRRQQVKQALIRLRLGAILKVARFVRRKAEYMLGRTGENPLPKLLPFKGLEDAIAYAINCPLLPTDATWLALLEPVVVD